jgi:hypothetical protein
MLRILPQLGWKREIIMENHISKKGKMKEFYRNWGGKRDLSRNI